MGIFGKTKIAFMYGTMSSKSTLIVPTLDGRATVGFSASIEYIDTSNDYNIFRCSYIYIIIMSQEV